MFKDTIKIAAALASLWDGQKHLSGKLFLTRKNLVFKFDDFRRSHLKLEILLEEIGRVDTFLIFENSRKGL